MDNQHLHNSSLIEELFEDTADLLDLHKKTAATARMSFLRKACVLLLTRKL